MTRKPRNSKGQSPESVIAHAEREPAAARELAAARLASNIVWALNDALRARGWQAKQLAEELGVGESAVSQVLNSDGNLRVATIGKYFRAMGYQARLVAEPVDGGTEAISLPRRTPRSRRRPGTAAPARLAVVAGTADWQVFRASDGGVWALEAEISEPAGGRMVIQAECTLLSPTPDDPRRFPVSVAAHEGGDQGG